jgi:NhaP-type Na+/H+ or K+/H+ antiporter
MPTALTIVFVGCTIFLSHYFASLFVRTKIPDVLWLFTIGLLLGPVFGVVSTENFGAVGPVFTTITLVFILFESGIDQRLEPLINSLSGTAKITTYNFFGSLLVAGAIAYFYTDLGLLRSLALGSIVGGTSSAVVTTLARQFPMTERSRTILVLESAFSDVFTLAVPLTLLTALVYFAEHWVIDGLGGWALVGVSFLMWNRIERRQRDRRAEQARNTLGG